MKEKIIKYAIILVIALAIGGIIYAGVILNKKDKKGDEHLIELKFSELEDKINKKEDFILVVTQTNCSHCESYKPILKDVLVNYDIVAYEINTKKLSKEEYKGFSNIININGTPTTIFFRNGEETTTSNRLIGEQKYNNIVRRFQSLGYIKE